MRFDGKLEKWNDDRGFGFIAPLHGGEPVFVHVSAFARDGRRPKVGEALTFEVEPAGDGKKRAVNVQRPGPRLLAPSAVRRQQPRERRRALPFRSVGAALILIALGSYAYTQFAASGFKGRAADRDVAADPPPAAFRCDGRTHCSQMTSCEEAKFFLKNCHGVKMDGDGDGIPCEMQWCGRR